MKLLTFIAAAATGAIAMAAPTQIKSPGGELVLNFELLEGGVPSYNLDFKGKKVVAPSRLGLTLDSESGRNDFNKAAAKTAADALSLREGFEIAGTDTTSFDETWHPVWGEETAIRNNYNELAVKLRQPDFDREMTVRFRLYDDGLGFRYEFPAQPHLTYFVIKEEDTEFAMTGDHTAWWIPGDYDTQEYNYTKSRLSTLRHDYAEAAAQSDANASATKFSPTGVQTALQLKTDDGEIGRAHV